MNILIVGNILKDVYLNLDSRTDKFETDKNGVKWLNLAFNASEHHFFSRNSSIGGAAVTLEVLEKMGLPASISNSELSFLEENHRDASVSTHRYILISDSQVAYFAPSKFRNSVFIPPMTPIDYLYIDRSAELSSETVEKIFSFLNNNPATKLILYLKDSKNPNLNSLIKHANLIFLENHPSEENYALELDSFPTEKIIHISEKQFSYQKITENVSVERIDMLTHLSAYSIASATILGSFILGLSVEDSLKMARANVENSKLDSVLPLEKLKKISLNPNKSSDLELIAANLVLSGKGILAADESGGSIKKKFEKLNIPDTYDNRRDYRNIFFTTKDLEKYVNGVILFDETARQFADNGQNFVDYLTGLRIIPGIKVDQGLEKFNDSTPKNYDSSQPVHPDETWTKGLDNLETRLKEYYQMGLRFAKWRAAFEVRFDENGNLITPTNEAIRINCEILAEYALKCQNANIVPIVEPELVYDGYYNIEQSAEITSRILDCLFEKLKETGINLRACILKVNMVLAGKQFEGQSSPEEVGEKTAKVLKEHVPAELAGVVFLSGGQTVEQATANLEKIENNNPFPWPVTFSFARALQDPALYAWQGDNNNLDLARSAFLERLIKNTEALKK